jgi:staphylococcal nuclease domain-containing protein 1
MATAAAPAPAPAQLRAAVKSVLSPDTIVLRGRTTTTGGPAPERQLSFAYITAPRLGRKDEKDEVRRTALRRVKE